MARVEATVPTRHARDLDDLFGRGVRAGRVDEARGETPRAVLHRLGHEPLHPGELLAIGRATGEAHHGDAEGAVAHELHDVEGRALRVERLQVVANRPPPEVHAPRHVEGEPAQLLEKFGGRGRGREAAVAHDLRRHALADLRLGAPVLPEPPVRVRMHVDEPRRQHTARGPERQAGRLAREVADRRDDVVAAVGDLSGEAAGLTLWAAGRVLAPGFIDMHSHSDWRLWENRRAESKIRQGVTTEVVGNCGFSPAPVSDKFLDDLRGFALHVPAGMDFSWRSVGDYLRAFDASGTALNVIQLIGHGTLRVAAMGFARRAPTAAELSRMQRLLADGIEDGAWGLSTGLIYAPGSYATTDEVVTLAKVAARHRGFYASHIRGEGATLLDAVREAIRVGREGELPVQVSHIKAAGRPNWGKVADALALIDRARDEELDVTA